MKGHVKEGGKVFVCVISEAGHLLASMVWSEKSDMIQALACPGSLMFEAGERGRCYQFSMPVSIFQSSGV